MSASPSTTAAAAAAPKEPEVQKGVSSWAVAWRQFKRNKVAMFALGVLALMGLVAFTSPLLANDKPLWVSLKGRWYFPAFKDYLDENFPIPFGIPGKLRRFSLFSPAYQGEIERPVGVQFPEWGAIRREIDSPAGRERGDWYLLPPVPYYYKQTSRGIKLLPGVSLARLDLTTAPADDPRALLISPNERWEEVWEKEHRDLGEVPWARVIWSDRQDGWVLDDGSRMKAVPPRGWLTIPARTAEDSVVVRRFEQARTGGRLDLFEDLDSRWLEAARQGPADELAERVRERLKQAWPDLEVAGAMTTVGGHPALVSRQEAPEKGLPARRVWAILAPDRMVGAVLTIVDPTPEQLAAVEGSLEVVPATGATLGGVPAAGAPRRLQDGDAVVIPTPDGGSASFLFRDLPRHHLGTDDIGRDVLSRLIHGTVIAGSVGIVSVSIYVTIGIILGALAGYFRGWVDLVISRIIEVVICFPTMFLIITIVSLWPPSIYNIMIALGLISWTGVARLVRGEFLKIMAEDFVQAARALGLSDGRIIFRHVLPNGIAPVFVSASFGVAGAILVESSLSFLGFGVAPPTASWGEVLQQGRRYIHENLYHLVWAPGFCIFLTVTMFNLVGEGLRDALDPKLRQ